MIVIWAGAEKNCLFFFVNFFLGGLYNRDWYLSLDHRTFQRCTATLAVNTDFRV